MNVGYLAHVIKMVNMFQVHMMTAFPHNHVMHILNLDLDHMLWCAICNYRWHYFLVVVLVIYMCIYIYIRRCDMRI